MTIMELTAKHFSQRQFASAKVRYVNTHTVT